MFSRALQKEVLLFLASGAIAALVNFFSRKILAVYLPLPWAITLAYFLGMLTAFSLFRQHVFTHNTDPASKQAFRFFLVNLLAVAQTLLITLVFASKLIESFEVDVLGFPLTHEDIAHGIGICVPTISSYLGHKYYSFRQNDQS